MPESLDQSYLLFKDQTQRMYRENIHTKFLTQKFGVNFYIFTNENSTLQIIIKGKSSKTAT